MYRTLILRELWEDLDAVVYRLMTDGTPDDNWSTEDYKSWGTDIGEARGLALAIAKITNLSQPDVEAVRAKAMERWEKSLEEPTPIGRFPRLGDNVRLTLVDPRRSRVVRTRVSLGRVRRVAGSRSRNDEE